MAFKKGNKLATGRPIGAINKATADIKALCQAAAPVAIAKLVELAAAADSQATQVAAIKELLDRGYGKSPQATSIEVVSELVGLVKIDRVKAKNGPDS